MGTAALAGISQDAYLETVTWVLGVPTSGVFAVIAGLEVRRKGFSMDSDGPDDSPPGGGAPAAKRSP
jgi:hypothetical protein